MIREDELVHEAGRCGWECDHADHLNRIKFVLPMLPPSINSIYNVFWSQRRVELKPEIRAWKSRAKQYIPMFKVEDDSMIAIKIAFTYPWYHKNNRFRKFDTHNMLKPLIDAISEKIGVDDSRLKAGSWASIDSPNESVTVTLIEVPHDDD